jgi:hypothetical protein
MRRRVPVRRPLRRGQLPHPLQEERVPVRQPPGLHLPGVEVRRRGRLRRRFRRGELQRHVSGQRLQVPQRALHQRGVAVRRPERLRRRLRRAELLGKRLRARAVPLQEPQVHADELRMRRPRPVRGRQRRGPAHLQAVRHLPPGPVRLQERPLRQELAQVRRRERLRRQQRRGELPQFDLPVEQLFANLHRDEAEHDGVQVPAGVHAHQRRNLSGGRGLGQPGASLGGGAEVDVAVQARRQQQAEEQDAGDGPRVQSRRRRHPVRQARVGGVLDRPPEQAHTKRHSAPERQQDAQRFRVGEDHPQRVERAEGDQRGLGGEAVVHHGRHQDIGLDGRRTVRLYSVEGRHAAAQRHRGFAARGRPLLGRLGARATNRNGTHGRQQAEGFDWFVHSVSDRIGRRLRHQTIVLVRPENFDGRDCQI